ncbi:hypothetical protein, partial [[Eubacterium] cellulosolvens]
MQGYIADNAAGLFLINDKGEVLESWIFSKDPVESVSLLTKIYDRKPVKQEKKFLKNVQKFKFTTIFSDNQALVEALKSKIPDLAFSRPSERITEFRSRFPEYAVDKKLFKDKEEWTQYNREFALHLARKQVTVSAARRDLSVVQMVRAIDDLDKS